MQTSTDSETLWLEEMAMAKELLRRTVIENPFVPKLGGLLPSPPQAYFLTVPVPEILYGGAAGGGKSAGILAAALQYVTEPGYDALILRRSYADLEKPGSLIPLSKEWLLPTAADYNEQTHRWTFPSGATLSFGHVQNDTSVVQDYQGSAFAFIGFDELTQFTEFMYRYLFSRLRKTIGLRFPSRMRATSNPGGVGHEWVRKRFIDAADGIKRLFIPARLEDNPGLDREDYEESLAQLDPVTRAQLRHGDWDIRPEGNLFKRAWFADRIVARAPGDVIRRVRYWDFAATAEGEGVDPDWTVGVRMGITSTSDFVIEDVQRLRGTPREVERLVSTTAGLDGYDTAIRIEQEPGSSGKMVVSAFSSGVLEGYDVRGVRSTGDKITRAGPFSAACEARRVYLLRGTWVPEFLDVLCAFPTAAHDDDVDGASGAHASLTRDGKAWEGKDFSRLFQAAAAKPMTPREILIDRMKNKRI
jgi:predicted phage terminase large subunit-like protein